MTDEKKYPESFQEAPPRPMPVYAGPEFFNGNKESAPEFNRNMTMMVYAGPQYYAPVPSPGAFGDPTDKKETSVSEEKKMCFSCGATLPMTAKFCSDCGEKQPTVYLCPTCGKVYTELKKFCIECGTELPRSV